MGNARGWVAVWLLACVLVTGCGRQTTVAPEPAAETPTGALTPTQLPGYTRASSAGSVATSTATSALPAKTPSPVTPTATSMSSTATAETATPAPPTFTPGPGTPTAAPSPTPESTATEPATATPVPPTPTATPTSASGWQVEGWIAQGEYDHQIDAGGVTFYWRSDGTYLYCALSGFTTGWLAIGIEPEEQMRGANFLFGYVHGGKAYVADMYGAQPFGANSHPPDTDLGGSDDILDYGGRESDGLTVLEFMIPLDSGDPYDQVLRPGESYDVILALGDEDSFDSYHVSRAWGEIILD